MGLEENWAERCLEQLEGLGFEWFSGGNGPGAGSTRSLGLSDGERTWSFRVECLRHVRPSTLAYQLTAGRSGARGSEAAPPLLLSERISRSVGELLRDRGVGYVDASGNAWIQQPGLHVRVEGRPPLRTRAPKPRTATTTALQVIYLLLQRPDWVARPYRELAERTGLALGTIGWVLGELKSDGWLRGHRSQRELVRPEELCNHWEQHWHDKLRPHLGPRTCTGGPQFTYDALLERCAEFPRWLVGGQLAAVSVLGGLEPASATLHVPPGTIRECMKALKLLPDPAGDIRILETFGRDNAWEGSPHGEGGRARFADPLLVRAELLESRDERLHGMADELLKRYVTTRWPG